MTNNVTFLLLSSLSSFVINYKSQIYEMYKCFGLIVDRVFNGK